MLAKGPGWSEWSVLGLLFMMLIIANFRGCLLNPGDARRALEEQGYKDPVVEEQHICFAGFRGCSGSDAAAFDVEATNVLGKRVKLLVCAGWPFKGLTVRSK